jgi:hypothetical protein
MNGIYQKVGKTIGRIWENSYSKQDVRWTVYIASLGWSGVASLALLIVPLLSLFFYFTMNKTFLKLYEENGFYLWWPLFYGAFVLISIGILTVAVCCFHRDPVRAGSAAPLFLSALANLFLLVVILFFFARSWSYVPFSLRLILWLICIAIAYFAWWLIWTSYGFKYILRKTINRFVLVLMNFYLGGCNYSELLKDTQELTKEYTDSRSSFWKKSKASVVSFIIGFQLLFVMKSKEDIELALDHLPVKTGTFKNLLRFIFYTAIIFKKTLTFILWRPIEAILVLLHGIPGFRLFFKHGFDHYLRVLQCRANNKLVSVERQWVKCKWDYLEKMQIERDMILEAALNDLGVRNRQLGNYANLYQGFTPVLKTHVFSVPWMVNILWVDFALDRIIRQEQIIVYQLYFSSGDEFSEKQPDITQLRKEIQKEVRDVSTRICPSQIVSLLETLGTYVQQESLYDADDPNQWLFATKNILDEEIPWDYVQQSADDLAEQNVLNWERAEWDPYDIQFQWGNKGAANSAILNPLINLLAVRRMTRSLFNLWILRIAQASPELAIKVAHECLDRFEKNKSFYGLKNNFPIKDFMLGAKGQRILGDIYVLITFNKLRLGDIHLILSKQFDKLKKDSRKINNFNGLLQKALDCYMQAGAPEDYIRTEGLILKAEKLSSKPQTGTG